MALTFSVCRLHLALASPIARQTVQQNRFQLAITPELRISVVSKTGWKTANQPCVLARTWIFETSQFTLEFLPA
jgi:hypothetical protein